MIAAQAEPKKDIFNYLAKVLPEVFEKYLRIPRLPPANNTVVFVTKEVC